MKNIYIISEIPFLKVKGGVLLNDNKIDILLLLCNMITIMSNIYILVSVRYGEVFLIPCIFILYPVLIPKYLQTEGSKITF